MKGKEGGRRGRRQWARAEGSVLGEAAGVLWDGAGHRARLLLAPSVFFSVPALLAKGGFRPLYISKLCGK